MHDPQSLICNIRIPIPFMAKARKEYRGGYIQIADIWHKDPCKDGSDDSCGRFMRARHGDPELMDKVVGLLSDDWDRTYQSSPEDYADDLDEYGPHINKVRFLGMFRPNGQPLMSSHGIVLNIYFRVLLEHFKGSHEQRRKKAYAYMNRHMAQILIFAENPYDSLHQGITCAFGETLDPKSPHFQSERKQRIRRFASAVYGDVLRTTRPWWRSPSLHVHHWRVVFPWWINLRRLLWDRCCKCNKTLGWNKCVVSDWGGKNLTCHRCSRVDANLKQD
jgi:hypothetical protein